jgi:hypothetical protein
MASISLKYKSKSGNLTAPGDVDPGAMIPLATTTLATATATITFSSIPREYEHLQIRLIGRSSRSSGVSQFKLNFNGDTGTNYSDHYLLGSGGGSAIVGHDGASQTFIWANPIAGNTTTAGTFGVGIIDILDYSNTNKNKTVRMLGGFDENGGGYLGLSSGLWMNTAAITSITIGDGYGQNLTTYTSAALYGIKRAGA